LRIVWSPLAIKRAMEQARHIAEDKPTAAERWLTRLFASVGKLAEFPQVGRIVPELALPEFRELDFGGYRVIYRVEAKRVAILTVRHSRRLLELGDLGAEP
jgi:toxin ParE1/3/4